MRYFARTFQVLGRPARALRSLRRDHVYILSAAFLIALFVLISNLPRLTEDVMFAYDHTAGRACRYGTKHLSANEPENYDFARAQYFLEACRELDPTFPGVNYHLARIYFIQRRPIASLMSASAEIRVSKGDPIPEVYYMKGLVEGALGEYDLAAKDYREFIRLKPEVDNGWAPYNDLAWVLLKGGHTQEALEAINTGLEKYPTNAWLLTIKATTLYELHRLDEALSAGEQAVIAADALDERMWRSAYPGNDPRTTKDGLETIRRSTRENVEHIKADIAARH